MSSNNTQKLSEIRKIGMVRGRAFSVAYGDASPCGGGGFRRKPERVHTTARAGAKRKGPPPCGEGLSTQPFLYHILVSGKLFLYSLYENII